MSEMETWARLYRCRKCGKWSHAKRKPKKHLRGYVFADTDYGPDIRYEDCGPFDYWSANYQGYDESDGNPKEKND